jgi:hypothetical protein
VGGDGVTRLSRDGWEWLCWRGACDGQMHVLAHSPQHPAYQGTAAPSLHRSKASSWGAGAGVGGDGGDGLDDEECIGGML